MERPRRRVVLVVEDDEPIAQLLKGAINDEDGYIALRVGDAEHALRAVEAVKTDLLLVDIELPGMSGLDLYDRLREHPRLRDVPVIFETGCARAHDDEMRARGIATYVRKPFELDHVLSFIKRLVPPAKRGSPIAA